MFDAIFGITPISNLMWSLLALGLIGSVVIGVGAAFVAWLRGK